MTLYELKGRYTRLSQEIDTLAAEGASHEARLLCLMNELDQVHRELGALRLRSFAVPTLRDVVGRADASPGGAVVLPMPVPGSVAHAAAALSMAG